MISPNLHAIWVFLLMNLSQDLKCFLLRYFGTLGDGYSLKGSNKKPSRHSYGGTVNVIFYRYSRKFLIRHIIKYFKPKKLLPRSQKMGCGSGIRDPETGSEIQYPRSRIRDPGSEIQDPRSRIRVPWSEIQDPRSRIRVPWSRIRKILISDPRSGSRCQKGTGSQIRIRNTARQVPEATILTVHTSILKLELFVCYLTFWQCILVYS